MSVGRGSTAAGGFTVVTSRSAPTGHRPVTDDANRPAKARSGRSALVTMPGGASTTARTALSAGMPVTVCGLPVQQGELLHGDENGLITVPFVDPEKIRAAVDDVRAREKKIMDYVRGASFTIDGFEGKVYE